MSEPISAPTKELPQFNAPKKKRKWLRRLILLLIILAVVAVAVLRLLKGGAKVMAGNYIPAPVQARDMTVAVTGPGTIKPNDTYRATTLIRGEILTAPFEEGDTVSKDDVLFTLDASDVENAVKQAQTGVEQAQLGVQNAQSSIEQAELNLKNSQLQYNTLLKNRSDNAKDRQVKANGTGVVNKLYVDPGDTVGAGTPIADILDREHMKLTVPFHAVDAQSFTVGQSAVITVSGTTEKLTGSVHEIAATNAVGPGGTLTRNVTLMVDNPGALSPASTGSAAVGAAACAASGSFQYAESKQLIALYSGKLEKLDVREGDWVTDGQVIGEFEEKQFQEQIDAAAIALDNAKITRKNAGIALQNAQLSLRNAQDNLERITDSLDDYIITSPIDGTVIEKNYKAGDNIDPTTASATGASAFMAVIYDMSRLTFDINIDELDAVKVRVGQKVTITADALDGMSFTGTVDKININGTTMSGKTTYPATILVDGVGTALAQQGLWPGMNVSANIIVEEAGKVLSVPVEAVTRGNVVRVPGAGALDKDGNLVDFTKLEDRIIETGRTDGEYIEVLSGLSEGETVFFQTATNNSFAMMMGGV